MQSATNNKKECLACGKVLHGRADKKFCNDYCRNEYNNKLKSATSSVVRTINNTLLKNRRILEKTLGEEETKKTTKERLLQQGFQFKYLTHSWPNKKGDTYFFCYDYGYLPLDNDWFLVVRRTEK